MERARLVTRQLGTDALRNFDSHNGDAAKLTVYVGRQERVAGKPAHYAMCDLLHRHGFAGAIVLLGVDGTAHGERYRARFFGRNVNVPLMIIAIGTTAQVSAAATELAALVPNPLLTVERVRLCKRDGELFARPQQLPTTDEQGRTLWQKLMVYTAEGASRMTGCRSIARSSNDCCVPGLPAGRRCCAASGDFTATINRTGTSYFRSRGGCR